jgi:hypothetical protein
MAAGEAMKDIDSFATMYMHNQPVIGMGYYDHVFDWFSSRSCFLGVCPLYREDALDAFKIQLKWWDRDNKQEV